MKLKASGKIRKESAGASPDTAKRKKVKQEEPQHTRLSIEEIRFVGNNPLDKDTEGPFREPEWQRGRSARKQSPICYTRKETARLVCTFRVTKAPSQEEFVEIKGTCSPGGVQLEWVAQIAVRPADKTVSTAPLNSSVELPDIIACFDPLEITWQAQAEGQGWEPAGSSSHLLYLVLAPPMVAPLYWSLVDISCRSAHGKKTADELADVIFTPFRSMSVRRKRDGKSLTYWNPETTTATNTRQLLSQQDGSGQCGSWAEFLVDMFKAHGLQDASKVLVVCDLDRSDKSLQGFLVKHWAFTGAGSLRGRTAQLDPKLYGAHTASYTHEMNDDCTQLMGAAGQGNPEPPPAFYNHFIVVRGNRFYDPSYGTTFTTQRLWEEGSIDGLYISFRVNWCSRLGLERLEFWNLRTQTRI
ncbi:MAG: hypothetical protein EOO70_02010 [Myxococcaceae bacterium]|nr:MAG: hypothetical protein EOO70_02010 [Myxococcaceae bacterium]